MEIFRVREVEGLNEKGCMYLNLFELCPVLK